MPHRDQPAASPPTRLARFLALPSWLPASWVRQDRCGSAGGSSTADDDPIAHEDEHGYENERRELARLVWEERPRGITGDDLARALMVALLVRAALWIWPI